MEHKTAPAPSPVPKTRLFPHTELASLAEGYWVVFVLRLSEDPRGKPLWHVVFDDTEKFNILKEFPSEVKAKEAATVLSQQGDVIRVRVVQIKMRTTFDILGAGATSHALSLEPPL